MSSGWTRADTAQVTVCGMGPCPTCGQETSNKVGFIVAWTYTKAGTWSIGIAPLDDESTIPEWPMKWGQRHYSATLSVEVPEGTRVIGGQRNEE